MYESSGLQPNHLSLAKPAHSGSNRIQKKPLLLWGRRPRLIAVAVCVVVLCLVLAWTTEKGRADVSGTSVARASGRIETEKINISTPQISSKFSIEQIGQSQIEKSNSVLERSGATSNGGQSQRAAVGEPVGVVNKIYVHEGEPVSKGQKLMTLDDRILSLTVQKRRAEVEEAQANRTVLDENEDELNKGLREINKAISMMQSGIGQMKEKEKELADALALMNAAAGQTNVPGVPGGAGLQTLPPGVTANDLPQTPEELQNALNMLRMERGRLESQLKKVKRQRSKLVSALDSVGSSKGVLDAAVSIAEIGLDKSKRDLEKTVIAAPAGGVVSRQNAREGEAVFPNQSLFTISDTSKVLLTLYLPEEQARLVKKGQDVVVSVDSYPDRVFKSTVKRIADVIEFAPTNLSTDLTHLAHTQWISIEIKNNKGILKDGMPADAEIFR
jgi:multidrug resistance efflux pump